jgi:Protein kinase domain
MPLASGGFGVTAGFLPVPVGRRDEMAGTAADRVLVNRYALKTPLGRGGMGVVWRALDVVLAREVAVKEVALPASLSAAELGAAQARVAREARAAARLNHPGVVTLYDVVTAQGSVFLVMELVEAPTLAELVWFEGPLAPERVAELGVQLASILEAAHHAGIVHRDVQPANVLVPPSGSVKLADFGVASLADDPRLTTTGVVIGSPAYMAPEQAKGEEAGPPADFWALGRRCTTRLRASRRSTRARRWRLWLRWSTRRRSQCAGLVRWPRCWPPCWPRTRRLARPVRRSGPGWPGFWSWHLQPRRALASRSGPRGSQHSNRVKRRRWSLRRDQHRSSGHPARSSHRPHPCPPGAMAARRGWRVACGRDADRLAGRGVPARRP